MDKKHDDQGETKATGGAVSVGPGSDGAWRALHEALRALANRRGRLDTEEARTIVDARAASVHARLGYTSFAEYLAIALGYPPRQARERIRIAEALEALAQIRDALASGRLSYSATRELLRVVTPETEAAWLAAAAGCTVREIEALVAGRKRGELPGEPREVPRRASVLRLAVSEATKARFRAARRHLEYVAGRELSMDELVAQMCDAVLGAGAEPAGRGLSDERAADADGAGAPTPAAGRDDPASGATDPASGVTVAPSVGADAASVATGSGRAAAVEALDGDEARVREVPPGRPATHVGHDLAPGGVVDVASPRAGDGTLLMATSAASGERARSGPDQ